MRFTRAIVRPPSATFADGLTSSSLGAPDLSLALAQHAAYCDALRYVGLDVVSLEPDDHYPDSTFVEDTAVLTEHGAIITRPGATSRAGEVDAVEKALRWWYSELGRIAPPGTVDGGDICQTETEFLIGLSHRTDENGAAQLAEMLKGWGFSSRLVDIRPAGSILHLKSGVNYIGEGRLLAWSELAGHPILADYEVIVVDPDERYASNAVRINDHLLLAAGHPKLEQRLRTLGYHVIALEMSEFEKMDGGLSCLSLRF